jgi:putative membrane protein
MITKKNIPFWELFRWSKTPFLWGFVYSSIIAILYYYIEVTFKIDISLPWQPIAVLGTTVGFYLGFKNNASYDRTWEARKIWDGIASTSRNFSISLTMFFDPNSIEQVAKKDLIYRHLAWLSVLRFEMRLTKNWEQNKGKKKERYFPGKSEQSYTNLKSAVCKLITKEEFESYSRVTNVATQILNKQGQLILDLHKKDLLSAVHVLKLYDVLSELSNFQGASERIKNFPFPRQYASVTYWLTLVFAIFIPIGFLNIFATQNIFDFICTIFISSVLIWTYFLMEKIGHFSENPFQGSIADVPIDYISSQIELELKNMLGEPIADLPIQEEGYIM